MSVWDFRPYSVRTSRSQTDLVTYGYRHPKNGFPRESFYRTQVKRPAQLNEQTSLLANLGGLMTEGSTVYVWQMAACGDPPRWILRGGI